MPLLSLNFTWSRSTPFEESSGSKSYGGGWGFPFPGLLRPQSTVYHGGLEGRTFCEAVTVFLRDVDWYFSWHGESDVFVIGVGFNWNVCLF